MPKRFVVLIGLAPLVLIGCGSSRAPKRSAETPPEARATPAPEPRPRPAREPTPTREPDPVREPPAKKPPPPTPAAAAEAGVPAHLKGILTAHNEVRARHCAPPLVWSAKVAAVAQKWADKLRGAGCGLQHSQSGLGENLAAGTEGMMTPERVVGMWYGEIDAYDFKRPGFAMNTGHFTQVVWKGSRQLGCATATCKGLTLWVCNYDPPGNWEGQFKTEVAPASSSCR